MFPFRAPVRLPSDPAELDSGATSLRRRLLSAAAWHALPCSDGLLGSIAFLASPNVPSACELSENLRLIVTGPYEPAISVLAEWTQRNALHQSVGVPSLAKLTGSFTHSLNSAFQDQNYTWAMKTAT